MSCSPSLFQNHTGTEGCVSVSTLQVICHGIPDKRPLQDGDIVNVDVTAFYKGYHGDLNETFVVGDVDEESKKLIKVTSEVCTPPLACMSTFFSHKPLSLAY